MGHSYAEMFPHGEDKTFFQRYARYQQACATEISSIIRKNTIKNEDIEIGDRLALYKPLLGMSKVRLDNEGEFHRIRELFAPTAKYYDSTMWALAYGDLFKVWDKRTIDSPVSSDDLSNKKTFHLVRIDEPAKIDWHPDWIDIRYFSKK